MLSYPVVGAVKIQRAWGQPRPSRRESLNMRRAIDFQARVCKVHAYDSKLRNVSMKVAASAQERGVLAGRPAAGDGIRRRCRAPLGQPPSPPAPPRSTMYQYGHGIRVADAAPENIRARPSSISMQSTRKMGSPSRFINQPRTLRQRLWPHHEGVKSSPASPVVWPAPPRCMGAERRVVRGGFGPSRGRL